MDKENKEREDDCPVAVSSTSGLYLSPEVVAWDCWVQKNQTQT